MIKIVYVVTFRKDSGFPEIELEESRGKNLGEKWQVDKTGIFDIDGNFYEGSQIIGITKRKDNML